MTKIVDQIKTGKYTLLSLDSDPPNHWNKSISIDGEKYKTEIVYDLPKHIAIIGSGDFVGKEVAFI